MRFDHNIIQNTNFLGDAVEHSLTSKLSLFTLGFLKEWPSNSSIATVYYSKLTLDYPLLILMRKIF